MFPLSTTRHFKTESVGSNEGSLSEGRSPGKRIRNGLFRPAQRANRSSASTGRTKTVGPLGRAGIETGETGFRLGCPDYQGVALRWAIAWAFGPCVARTAGLVRQSKASVGGARFARPALHDYMTGQTGSWSTRRMRRSVRCHHIESIRATDANARPRRRHLRSCALRVASSGRKARVAAAVAGKRMVQLSVRLLSAGNQREKPFGDVEARAGKPPMAPGSRTELLRMPSAAISLPSLTVHPACK